MSSAIYPLTDNDVLYFLHIPKTAGTSFNDILKANFAADESSFGVPVSNFVRIPRGKIAKFKAISGHYFYNIAAFTHRTPVYITMLRDPIERTVSDYGQIRRIPLHQGHELASSQSLLDFVKDPRSRFLWANLQTRHIALDLDLPDMASKMSTQQLENWELSARMDQTTLNGDFDDPGLLEQAQERLSKFAFVGILERFDESVDVLCHLFGWTAPPIPKVLNVSPNRPEYEDIPQEALDIICEHTRLDAALYEMGKQLFDVQYTRMIKDYPEKVKHFTPDLDNSNGDMVALQRQIAFQKRVIDGLQVEKAALERRIHAIDNSFGWRFVLRFNAVRRAIIPSGSILEKFYLRLRGR